MMQHFPAYHERRMTDGTHVFVATTGGAKRDGLALDMAGGQFDNYLRNPVFLWAHDYQGRTLPIGKTVKLVSSKTKLRAHVVFDQGDEFARLVERKFDDGFLSAVSVGWMDMERDTQGIITKWDLLDISAVPVPGDPDALIEREMALIRGFLGEHEDHAIEDPPPEPAAVLELEEPEEQRAAIPPHTTAKADESLRWDGPGEVAKAEGREQLRLMHAWVDSGEDEDLKRAYKLPHHRVSGEVVWAGVAAAMARLLQASTDIPDEDREGVWRHLERHYRQFDKTPPEMRSTEGYPAAVVAGMLYHGEWQHYRAELAELIGEKVKDLEAALAQFNDTTIEQAPDDTAVALGLLADTLKEITDEA